MGERGARATVVVGAGRLARALVPLLAKARRGPLVVVARSGAAARAACRKAPHATATTDLARAVAGAALVLCAVPDRAIGEVAARLAGLGGIDWGGRVVLHHAGALGPEPLAPLAARGAAVGVLHPLQCFGGGPGFAEILRTSRARIEGAPRARTVARRLARDLGLVVLRFPKPLGPAERAAYHTAGGLVANDLVALVTLAVELLESTGLDRKGALRALAPLVRGTLAALERGGPPAALTGPVARGDLDTLDDHLRRLGALAHEDAEIHRLLSRRLARVAAEHGAIDRRTLARLLRRTGPDRRRGL